MIEKSSDTRESYITLDHFAVGRVEEKKSIFIGWASPISSQEDASRLIEKAKHQYPDATHHVYAWIMGGIVQQNKYSDDREPAGTAGMPVFNVLSKNHIEDGIIIVIRYFGGTLLGSGGLARAYASAAVQALNEAIPVCMRRCLTFSLKTSYSEFEKIKRALTDQSFEISVNEYGSEIQASISCVENKRDILLRLIADISNGRVLLEVEGSSYKKSLLVT